MYINSLGFIAYQWILLRAASWVVTCTLNLLSSRLSFLSLPHDTSVSGCEPGTAQLCDSERRMRTASFPHSNIAISTVTATSVVSAVFFCVIKKAKNGCGGDIAMAAAPDT